jgi:hypothetical protein
MPICVANMLPGQRLTLRTVAKSYPLFGGEQNGPGGSGDSFESPLILLLHGAGHGRSGAVPPALTLAMTRGRAATSTRLQRSVVEWDRYTGTGPDSGAGRIWRARRGDLTNLPSCAILGHEYIEFNMLQIDEVAP